MGVIRSDFFSSSRNESEIKQVLPDAFLSKQVQMDIKDHMDMIPIRKHLFFLMLVDSHSALTVAYSMQKELDALRTYREFAKHSWNRTRKRICYLRFENAE